MVNYIRACWSCFKTCGKGHKKKEQLIFLFLSIWMLENKLDEWKKENRFLSYFLKDHVFFTRINFIRTTWLGLNKDRFVRCALSICKGFICVWFCSRLLGDFFRDLQCSYACLFLMCLFSILFCCLNQRGKVVYHTNTILD